MSEWISVKDATPTPNVSVLIWSATHDFDGPSIGWMDADVDKTWKVWHDATEWVDDEGYYSNKHVSHWMPLPKAPEEK